MKIKLDTSNQTIGIESQVNLNELFQTLENLLPNGLWKKYELEVNSTLYWTNPIYPGPYTVYPWLTFTNGTGDADLTSTLTTTSGTYFIEV